MYASCMPHVCLMYASCMAPVWLMYGSCMAHVWLMYGSCMAHVWLMYASCMPNVCLMYAYVITFTFSLIISNFNWVQLSRCGRLATVRLHHHCTIFQPLWLECRCGWNLHLAVCQSWYHRRRGHHNCRIYFWFVGRLPFVHDLSRIWHFSWWGHKAVLLGQNRRVKMLSSKKCWIKLYGLQKAFDLWAEFGPSHYFRSIDLSESGDIPCLLYIFPNNLVHRCYPKDHFSHLELPLCHLELENGMKMFFVLFAFSICQDIVFKLERIWHPLSFLLLASGSQRLLYLFPSSSIYNKIFTKWCKCKQLSCLLFDMELDVAIPKVKHEKLVASLFLQEKR